MKVDERSRGVARLQFVVSDRQVQHAKYKLVAGIYLFSK